MSYPSIADVKTAVVSHETMAVYPSKSLLGKWALVTGSSGGIGVAIAQELATHGANLVLHGNRHPENAEKLADELRRQQTTVRVVLHDFANSAGLDAFVDKVWQIAPLDILVNNAGVDVLTGPAAEWSFSKKLCALWAVDVDATIHLSRAFGQRMKDRGTGSIVNIGWSLADIGMAGESGEYFAAVKGAVMAFSRSLAKSLAPFVRVNCVAPGWIQTKWGETASQYWQNRAASESLVGRWGAPADVAHVVRFLASTEAGFVNGQAINVDGGFASSSEQRDWS